MYLKGDVIGTCLMVTVDLFAEDVMQMVWLLLPIMKGNLSGVKVQLMQYQARLISSNWHPAV